jgi:hypothetical protein
MTEITSQPFYSRQLHAIAPGNLTLEFPTLDGIVQIDAPLEDEVTYLNVSKDTAGEIRVKVVNGRPLQAELAVPVVVDGQPTENHLRIFKESVEELKLSKAPLSPVERDMWVAQGENLVVEDITLLRRFVNTIGDFALLEQARRRKDAMENRKPSNKYL